MPDYPFKGDIDPEFLEPLDFSLLVKASEQGYKRGLGNYTEPLYIPVHIIKRAEMEKIENFVNDRMMLRYER